MATAADVASNEANEISVYSFSPLMIVLKYET